jgi:hypothetical protein
MEYPQPWTDAEREEILREHPNARFDEYHHEREFLVDRRALETVHRGAAVHRPAGS